MGDLFKEGGSLDFFFNFQTEMKWLLTQKKKVKMVSLDFSEIHVMFYWLWWNLSKILSVSDKHQLYIALWLSSAYLIEKYLIILYSLS